MVTQLRSVIGKRTPSHHESRGRTRLAALYGALVALAAAVPAQAEPIKNAVPFKAKPLPLTAVRLTGGPLKQAQDLDAKYLLELEPDRMLAGYRVRAGLEPKAEGYGGWDDVNGRQLTGHIAGHYLSAVSYMFAATGNEEFKKRADYIVAEMKEVQDKNGDGYLGALLGTRPGGGRRNGPPSDADLADGRELFQLLSQGTIRSGGFDLNGMWSPWYTLHKTYAGLRDAYRFTGNKTALELEIKFSEWAEKILQPLSDEQIQQMLRTEFGGMNEIFADLYADTGDERWLKLSYKFEHEDFIEPLQRGEDNLAGKHGNTQVPKLIGSLARYIYKGDKADGEAAEFFWDRVAHHHSFATGGHGKDEYFGQPDKLNDFIYGRTAETCNVYNMIKLTRTLFSLEPDAQFAEFQERALFNHILGSIDPTDGSTCYMVPVGQGVQREYGDMQRSFTCCVGSGMESHALHGDGVYYASDDHVCMTIYTPSTADWAAGGVKLAVDTDFPTGESATIEVTPENEKEFTLSLRRPSWAGEGFSVEVNGEAVDDLPEAGEFVDIKRTWKAGDKVSVKLPKALHLEPLPDNDRRVAVMWGPLVLAGDLSQQQGGGFGGRRRGQGRQGAQAGQGGQGGQGGGRRGQRGGAAQDTPAFIAAGKPVEQWLKPAGDVAGRFRTEGVGRNRDLAFEPFYTLHRKPYSAYFDLYTAEEWDEKAAQLAAERIRQRRLELATVGYFQPGEMQPERDYNYQGEDMQPNRAQGRAGRVGTGWFSLDMPVDAKAKLALSVTYHTGDSRRRTPSEFTISIDGEKLADVEVEPSSPPKFVDVEYAIPAELIGDKAKVTVQFDAKEERQIGPVFGVRMIRQLDGDNAAVSTPPESFFEMIDEGDREVARAFYKKYLEVDGMPVVAAAEVADEALERTRWIVKHMLAGRPDVVQALVDRQMYLIIIGKNQLYCDMPEYRNNPNPEYQNERVRGTGGRPTSFGEENVLSLPIDRYDDESIGVHEFCHTIDSAMGSIDPTWQERKNAAFRNAIDKGLYKLAYAGSNAGEYWAEVGQSYFDCNRPNNWNHGPVMNREQLRVYDPVGYELARKAFNLKPEQDWRYEYLQKHPVIIPPPGKFKVDPYYTKFTYAREFVVVGREASDEAMLKANDTIRKMFAYRHDILKALIADGVKVVVLGPGESVADLPEAKDAGRNVDVLARVFDYTPEIKLVCVSQENVLADHNAIGAGGAHLIGSMAKAFYHVTARRPVDPNWDRRGRAVQQYELRVQRLDERFGAKLDELFAKAQEDGKWKGTTAVNGVVDYWAAGVMAYFDALGQDAAPNDAPFPIATRAQLKEYDPALYELVRETMAYEGHVDWRYSSVK
jgi:DUF1680 family protein